MKVSLEEEELLLPLADNPSRLTLEERALLPEELEEERTAELLVALLREELLLLAEERELLDYFSRYALKVIPQREAYMKTRRRHEEEANLNPLTSENITLRK